MMEKAFSLEVQKRFWAKVDVSGDPDSCWDWLAFKSPKGYGQFSLDKKTVRAHRVSFFLMYGDPGDLLVCHSCDNPGCCNPKHLWLGDNDANVLDSEKKCRRGKALSKEQVNAIKSLKDSGIPQWQIASLFGTCQASISNIFTDKLWKYT